MQRKQVIDGVLDFQRSNLKITNQYFERYRRIDELLAGVPGVLDLAHRDLEKALDKLNHKRRRKGRRSTYTSEQVLRIDLCQRIEGLSLREVIIRIDDSEFLRRFVKVYDGDMIDFTHFNRLRNRIREETWKEMNDLLRDHAIAQRWIQGKLLRQDTTLIETNIHWPTDAALLWDTYRVLSRVVLRTRELDAEAAGEGHLQVKRAKSLYGWLQRKAGKAKVSKTTVQGRYKALISLVARIIEWSQHIAEALESRLKENVYGFSEDLQARALVQMARHYGSLGEQVVNQATQRVCNGEQLGADEKLYSIFEPHTELVQRGKAGKAVEFGHMIDLCQVEHRFISEYAVFPRRPVEHQLVEPSLENHREAFGAYPQEYSSDRGFYESMERIAELSHKVAVLSIPKKGSRNSEESQRESDPRFKLAQVFRAGIEGTISVLKRAFRLARCFSKGWDHYAASIGATIFAHNLVALARRPG